ncbi:hypothetical protein EVAR_74339_1 [Eumeta japonica]|uniref:Uncharacterized protein n=1 Tax=Eumeta variegata TaxID=151549 RepID=A0A4C1SDQ7_EUMVA|nr:hypothetical protein EVAR_74339_1 [Eumeta japonica]
MRKFPAREGAGVGGELGGGGEDDSKIGAKWPVTAFTASPRRVRELTAKEVSTASLGYMFNSIMSPRAYDRPPLAPRERCKWDSLISESGKIRMRSFQLTVSAAQNLHCARAQHPGAAPRLEAQTLLRRLRFHLSFRPTDYVMRERSLSVREFGRSRRSSVSDLDYFVLYLQAFSVCINTLQK